MNAASTVTRLRDALGARLVAYIGGVTTTAQVGRWAAGVEAPSDEIHARYLHAQDAVDRLSVTYGKVTIQSWFQGMNPMLGDDSPARVLRVGGPKDVVRVLQAAGRDAHA